MPGLMRGVARTAAVVGTATAVSGRVSHRQANRWAAQDEPQPQQQTASQLPSPPVPVAEPVYSAPVAAAESPPDDMNDTLEQLRQLGALKEQGILSEAEFEAQKARILAG